MKVQSREQVLHLWAVDPHGRRLGRIVGVETGTDLYSAEWFVLRLWGGRRLRAVPASLATWNELGVQVSYGRDVVVASPSLSSAAMAGDPAAPTARRYYAQRT